MPFFQARENRGFLFRPGHRRPFVRLQGHGFMAGKAPDFPPRLFDSLDIIHSLRIMRHSPGPVDGTRTGIIRRFSIDKRPVPRAVAFNHLSEVLDAAKDVFPAIVRIDIERCRRRRHELGNADGTDAGDGRIIKMAFCRKDGGDENRVNIIRIRRITNILGYGRSIAAPNILTDLVINHFFLRNSLDRCQGHDSQQKARHLCLTGFAKHQRSHSSPLTTILYF